MNKALFAAAMTVALAAMPALAQERQPYPADTPPADRPQSQVPVEEQAQTPQSDKRHKGEVEDLRERSMTAPNVRGERIPESPETGLPEPRSGNNPSR